MLIVEDDPALRHILRKRLRLDGHEVEVVEDGESALTYVARMHPEVVILDLGLPGKDGIEVLREMHERFASISVLVLTGRGEIEQRVLCLQSGADDVVAKPFSFHELHARLKALARRRKQTGDRVLRFGDLEMDRMARKVTQAGCEVELTGTEFSLLESLLRRGGERVCSRMELLQEVWQVPNAKEAGGKADEEAGFKAMGTNIVDVYINYLRKKLGRAAGRANGTGSAGRSVIRTVRGEGYLLGATESAG
jgi:DNA-binding response OmpR family regulator